MDSNNFRIVDELNILPIMAGSDIMITDTSSVAYEFLHFNRPLVTYKAVARRDKGINIQDPSELLPAIERSLNYPDEFSQNRESCLKDIHPYFDGNSSKRILEMIKKNREPDGVIIGIGINVNQKPEQFPDHLKNIATSIRIVNGFPIDRLAVIQSFLTNLEGQRMNHA